MKDYVVGWMIIGACVAGGYKLGKTIGIAQTKQAAYQECYEILSASIGEPIKDAKKAES